MTVRNVVLVHGAYADGSSWSGVIEHLQTFDLAVTAVQNPLSSLPDDVAHAQRILSQQEGPTILVGHSFAGTVITQAGVDPRVAGLVYVAARAPDVAEDHGTLSKQFPTAPASAGLIFRDGFGTLTERAFLNDFANGVDPVKARALHAVQGPVSNTLFGETTTEAAWRSKACWYAISRRDRTIAPDLQHFLAKRMDASTVEIDAGHLSLISHSEEIANLILRAARAE
jgi:pimeloyl-ACP methyl ester carboxylesterase